ncbi:ATP-binding protein [Noviherbaspirillum pedocola]|uniref:histidine kinase n=1 Tax=Noviherbaspirillum pedocola TaxID=2801341 RepID=A0A934W8Z2_9BURK|nr:ATP-binding protein [Noviherbaspirillum pedocola]MBK4739242.1 response regulator [Noviherbaspirillum pedocola]
MVVGDNKRLVQVVVNVLGNAAKYTHEGGNILLKTEVGSDQIVLIIEDDGIGMVPELVGRVFDLFTQAEHTPDRSSGGLGLGLALVKSLVELHGGTVACSSAGRGLGSRFIVSLPRLVHTDQRIERRRNNRDAIQVGKALKILIVDDNVDAAEALAMFLEASGHKVLVQNQSCRGLETARMEAPDVCLLDIGLPEMDGNELARRLRNQPETARAILIAITGYGQEDDRQNALAAGFDHHMVKPVDLAKLSAVLAAVGHRFSKEISS